MEGRETIMLGSNNYLGLTGDERVKQAAREALETYGTGAHRLAPAERDDSRCTSSSSASWPSGWGPRTRSSSPPATRSNLGCIGTILEPGDTVICDSGDHASILDGCRLSGAKLRPFRHNRMDKLERMLRARRRGRRRRPGRRRRRLLDGGRRLRPAAGSSSSARRYGARLMVDEAHGVGVLGARGAGACELFGLEDEVDLRMGTFSKSLASCGGFIAGPADVIEYLRISSRSFIFSASAVPAAVGAALGGAAGDPRRGPAAVRAAARQRRLPARGPAPTSACRWSSRARCPTAARRRPRSCR